MKAIGISNWFTSVSIFVLVRLIKDVNSFSTSHKKYHALRRPVLGRFPPFHPHNIAAGTRGTRNLPRTQTITFLQGSIDVNDDENDDENKQSQEWDQEDYDFMKDLSSAKQKLGTPIGYERTEEAEDAAENSQDAFLAAMNQVSKDFQASKEEVGPDRAVELMKSQWDMEDKLMNVQDEELEDKGEFE